MVTLDVPNVCLRIAQSSNCSTIAVCVQVGCEYRGTHRQGVTLDQHYREQMLKNIALKFRCMEARLRCMSMFVHGAFLISAMRLYPPQFVRPDP